MIRRRPVLVLVTGVAIVAALSGCATLDDDAARVDDAGISAESFETILDDVTGYPPAGMTVDSVTGTLDAEQARVVLGLMLRDTATTEYLAASGAAITDADREAFLEGIEPAQLEGLSEELQRLLVDGQVAGAAFDRVPAPSADELRERYETWPASAGVLCLRHILVATEAEADDVAARLADGEDFAAVAADVSTDEGSAAEGGALGTGDGSCLDLSVARQSLDPAFVAGAFDARAGVPTDPVPSQFGWHVILARPYEEIADSLQAVYADGAGTAGFAGFMTTAGVHVDPRYGAWDAPSGSIVALGQPAAPIATTPTTPDTVE